MKMYKMLRDPGGDGGGGGAPAPAAFVLDQHAPEELRGEASLKAFKTIPDLVKSYVSGQKLIGAKRTAIPAPDAPDAAWDAFYNEVGRPGTPDQYTDIPPEELKLPDGLTIDKAKMDDAKKMFHKIGLLPKQARELLKYYANVTATEFSGARTARDTSNAAAMTELKQAWGDKFGPNVEVAKSVIKKFGDESISAFLEESQLGNNVPLVKFLNKIGLAMLEDKQRGGIGGDFALTDQTKAAQEIETLKMDAAFQKMLTDAHDPGHQNALNRWTNLFKIAFPGKQES